MSRCCCPKRQCHDLAERHAQLLDQIIQPFDLTHDFGRKRAYEAAIDYARQNLVEDPHCNDFLNAAAKRLGFAAVTFDTLESRVKLPKNAWLDVWISDEDDEVAFTGTRDGIQYMIDLLTQLRDASDPEQHIHLDQGSLPMTENSANLVLFKEEETLVHRRGRRGRSGRLSGARDRSEADLRDPVHPLSARRSSDQRAPALSRDEGRAGRRLLGEVKEFGGHRESLLPLHLRRRQRREVHLQLPPRRSAVNYFTHREILKLAMRAV